MLELLTRVLDVDEFIRHICDAGGVECMVAAAAAHRNDRDVQLQATASLKSCARSDEFIRRICDAGAVECMVAAAASHRYDCYVQRRVVKCLEACTHFEVAANQIRELGGLACLFAATRTCANDMDVLATVTRALLVLRGFDSDSMEEHLTRIVAVAMRSPKYEMGTCRNLVESIAEDSVGSAIIRKHGGFVGLVLEGTCGCLTSDPIHAHVLTMFLELVVSGNTLSDVAVERTVALGGYWMYDFLQISARIVSRSGEQLYLCATVSDQERATFRKYGGDKCLVSCVRLLRAHPTQLALSLIALDYLSEDCSTASCVCERTLRVLLSIRREYQRIPPIHSAVVSLLCKMASHVSLHPMLNQFHVLEVLDEVVSLARAFSQEVVNLIEFARRSLRGEPPGPVPAGPTVQVALVSFVPVEGCKSIPFWHLVTKISVSSISVDENARLGFGATAEVKTARYEGEDVAVKQFYGLNPASQPYLSPEYKRQAKEMWTNEWEAGGKLGQHPNIVGLLGVAVDKINAGVEVPMYIVFELMWGSLTTALYASGMDLGKIIPLLCGVSRGLEHIHSRGFVHRDIKPGNILLKKIDGQWVAKIGDLGCAKKASEASSFAGTPLYVAPEMFAAGAITDRVDVFSLGVVIMEVRMTIHKLQCHQVALKRPPNPRPLLDASGQRVCAAVMTLQY